MPEYKQVERIIKILQRLALNREVTVNKLYDYFDRRVPKRTLQRDLVEISAAGIPLMTRPGNGRELIWYLEESYLRFIPATIGTQELVASYFLERLATVCRGTSLETDIQSLFSKAKQLVSPEVFRSDEGFDPGRGLFGATFMGYIDYASHSATIETLVKAATERQRCRFQYRSTWRSQISEFVAEPYLILYHKGALYGVVYVPHHENYIFLPVQRIREVEPLDEKFERDEDFSLESLREGRFGIFGYEGLKPEKVVLKFDAGIAEVVAERIWHPSQKLTHNDDGSLAMELRTVISDELRSWVAGWMDYVEVVRPKTLMSEHDTRRVTDAEV
jgi:predicted DNA-binding transcriptional regulator YafY